jgi:site-specific DNA recombinase
MYISRSLRAALYARVASPCSTPDSSIVNQLTALRQRSAADGCVVAEELCFLDNGSSGTTLLRPALQRLRDLVATGVVDRLYVYSVDRLSRSLAHLAVLVEEFHRCGVEIVFLKR